MPTDGTKGANAPELPTSDATRMFLQVLDRHGIGTDHFDAASSIMALHDWKLAHDVIADENAGEAARMLAAMTFTDLVAYGVVRELMQAPVVQAAAARGPSSRLLLAVRMPTFDMMPSLEAAFQLAFLQLKREHGLETAGVRCRSHDQGMRTHMKAFDDMKSAHVVVMLDTPWECLGLLGEISDAYFDLVITTDAIAFGVTATFGIEDGFPTDFDEAVRNLPSALLNTMADRFSDGKSFVEKVIAVHAAEKRRNAVTARERAAANIESSEDRVVDDGVVVLRKAPGKLTGDAERVWRMFESITDRPLAPMLHASDSSLSQIEEAWPHAVAEIRRMTADLVVGEPIRFRPTLLVGEPGSGKTSLLMAIADALGLPATVFPCASSSDNSFGGTAQRWSSASASTPLEAMRQSGIPNPVVILDEIEKSATESRHGTVPDTLLPMLEPHTAERYFEAGLNVSSDLSHVSFLATANSLSISAPLRDRFRILRMPDPGPEHVGVLSRRIVERLARDRGQEGLIPPLEPDEEDVVRRAWGGGSLRKLRRAVEVTLDLRDRLAVRQ